MTSWTCRETTKLTPLRACVDRGIRQETWHLDAAFAQPHTPDRWWFAASNPAGEVGALAAIAGTRAHLYGDDDEAVSAMATVILHAQKLHASRESHRHVLFGPARVVDPFWHVFQAVGRQVVADRRSHVMASSAEGKGSRRLRLTVATNQDQKLCVAFLAEHSAEQDGVDPRKVRPQGFAHEVATAIAAGSLVVGREQAPGSLEGRAMFVAEVASMPNLSANSPTVMLRRWYVPLPFRGRKILVAGALWQLRHHGPGQDKEVWLLLEGDALHLAATRAGYENRVTWREIAMLG